MQSGATDPRSGQVAKAKAQVNLGELAALALDTSSSHSRPPRMVTGLMRSIGVELAECGIAEMESGAAYMRTSTL